MRLLFLAAAGLLSSAVLGADRVITIPMGRKLPYRTVRGEALFQIGEPSFGRYYLGVGVTPQIEVEMFSDRLDQSRRMESFDVSYNQSAPITDLAPGISVGVLDVANKTPEGRRLFAAATFRIGLEGEAVNDVPMEVTIGGATNTHHPIFVGASVPFSSRLRLLAEHDSERVTFGAEIRPFRGAALRFLVRQGVPMGSVSLTRRF